jgi:hypothetical protein
MNDELRIEIQQMMATERQAIFAELDRKMPAYLQSPQVAKGIVKVGLVALAKAGVLYPIVTIKSLFGVMPKRVSAAQPADVMPDGVPLPA